MSRRFCTLDVFTDRALAGNPLAVVLDCEGLDGAAMQAIAREFNLSETVFVLPPQEARHKARLRIFTPARELAFAGHPTVGTAVLLGLGDAHSAGVDAAAFGLEEAVGTVACVVEADRAGRRGRARFRLPRLPELMDVRKDAATVAAALGLDPAEIGYGRHAPRRATAGTTFDFVPVRSLAALGRAKPDTRLFDEAFADSDHPAVFVYTNETGDSGHDVRARMFAPGSGIAEDPATGGAVAAFAGILMEFEALGDGEHDFRIGQGFEMGRPSDIALQLVVEGLKLSGAEIGGSAVVVSDGTLAL